MDTVSKPYGLMLCSWNFTRLWLHEELRWWVGWPGCILRLHGSNHASGTPCNW